MEIVYLSIFTYTILDFLSQPQKISHSEQFYAHWRACAVEKASNISPRFPSPFIVRWNENHVSEWEFSGDAATLKISIFTSIVKKENRKKFFCWKNLVI